MAGEPGSGGLCAFSKENMLQTDTAAGPPVVSMSHVQTPGLRSDVAHAACRAVWYAMTSNLILIRSSRARKTHFMGMR
jgi:hypothetical protein